MHKSILGPDRVLLLLSLIPYLREHGSVPVTELAERFGVAPALLRTLVRFLGTAGVPGETLSYQDEDLFDIDWDALELHDEVSLTRTVAVEEAPRFAPAETAALVAGLHALSGVLPPADAELARALAERLGAALGGSEPTMTVSAEADDARVAQLVTAVENGNAVRFEYRDAAGTVSQRTVEPAELTQRATGWYLRGFCRDRAAERTFRVDQMAMIRIAASDRAAPAPDPTQAPDPNTAQAPELAQAPDPNTAQAPELAPAVPGPRVDSPSEQAMDVIVRVSERALPRLAGFSPEILSEGEAGELLVRVSVWHRDSAIRLVQLAPGEIGIESPGSAREAVRLWAEQALASYGQ